MSYILNIRYLMVQYNLHILNHIVDNLVERLSSKKLDMMYDKHLHVLLRLLLYIRLHKLYLRVQIQCYILSKLCGHQLCIVYILHDRINILLAR